ncbi:hypothetical protein [Synechococcus lacustris]|uniref:hypothetical protein n=1 Tax=Synechococcus lacustris TaxID=2116544 RepID=UPI0020CE9FA0|nr:hypothetical protein [Synechococcus lacustris]MCP9795607.1 hypothetical protein [Synechococcus lacustris L1F-Slac]
MPTIKRRFPRGALILGGLLLALVLLVPITSLISLTRLPMEQNPMAKILPMPWAAQGNKLPIIEQLQPNSINEIQATLIHGGIHLENIYDLSLKNKTFSADGRFWLEWPEAVQKELEKQSLQPIQLIDFVNQVTEWEGRLEADNAQATQRGDKWFQSFNFSMQFNIHQLNLSRYPFNNLNLPITLAINPIHAGLMQRQILLLPARNQQGIIGEYANLDGYQLQSAQINPELRTYRTDYGLKQTIKASQLNINLKYSSSFWPAFIALLLPLIIILLIVLISPYLESSLGDIRIAVPSTALLTLVFLQQGYVANLPPSPYLTYLDRLYAVSYLICVSLFTLFAWSSNVFERTPAEHREKMVKRLDTYDRYFQLGAISLLFVISIEAWLH